MSTQIARAHLRARTVVVLIVIGMAIAVSVVAFQARAVLSTGPEPARSPAVSSVGTTSGVVTLSPHRPKWGH